MDEGRNKRPEPLRASGTLHGGLSGRSEATARLGPKPKPPRPKRFIKLAKALFKVVKVVGSIGSAIRGGKPFGTSWNHCSVENVSPPRRDIIGHYQTQRRAHSGLGRGTQCDPRSRATP